MRTFDTLIRLAAVAYRLDDSPQRFSDGRQYRIEIPSVEGPDTFAVVLEESADLGFRRTASPKAAVSRRSPTPRFPVTPNSVRSTASKYVCSSDLEPPGTASAAALTSDGRNIGWRNVGLRSLSAGFDDVYRAVELGTRSVLIADEGLAKLKAEA